MGIQKRRRSRARIGQRRSQWKAAPVTLVECPQCHSAMRPHRVCPTCGYYAGRLVVEHKETEK